MDHYRRPVPELGGHAISPLGRRAGRSISPTSVVWLPAPEPPPLLRASLAVAVCAATVALVAVALIAVIALLLGTVELGVALHEATHQAPALVGQTY